MLTAPIMLRVCSMLLLIRVTSALPALLGQPCDTHAECASTACSATPGGFCICPDGWYFVDSETCYEGKFDDPCNDDCVCDGDQLKCPPPDFKCACPDDTWYYVDPYCYEGLLGDPCTDPPDDCDTTDAVCPADTLVCSCPVGSYGVDEVCYEGALGEPCNEAGNCDTIGAVCSGDPQECTCPDGWFEIEIDDICCLVGWYPMSDVCYEGVLGDPCNDDDECDDINAECTGTCTCIDPWFPVGEVCKEVEIDEDCKHCICMVESGCQPLDTCTTLWTPCGYFQINYQYYTECNKPNGIAQIITNEQRQYWRDCAKDLDCACECFRQYMIKHAQACAGAGNPVTCEVIARVHAGGPNGCNDPATIPFWERVEACLALTPEN